MNTKPRPKFGAGLRRLEELEPRAMLAGHGFDGPFAESGGALFGAAQISQAPQVAAISAASILAKTARDNYMNQMHTVYPEYCFSDHKGYATKDHQRLLAEHGPCPLHRRSFEPVRKLGCGP